MSSTTKPPTDRLGFMAILLFTRRLYLGFVLINAFAPKRMEAIVFAGLNLAIVYGFGLILAAIFLALIYGILRQGETEATGEDGEETNS